MGLEMKTWLERRLVKYQQPGHKYGMNGNKECSGVGVVGEREGGGRAQRNLTVFHTAHMKKRGSPSLQAGALLRHAHAPAHTHTHGGRASVALCSIVQTNKQTNKQT